jgi:hypothetical protein
MANISSRLLMGVWAIVSTLTLIASPALCEEAKKTDEKGLEKHNKILEPTSDVGTAEGRLKVENIRLEPAISSDRQPAATLKFDLLNVTVQRLTDLVLKISIVEKGDADENIVPGHVLVGPFTFRGGVILEAGYLINFELLLQNFSPECLCVATVDVVSTRPVVD